MGQGMKLWFHSPGFWLTPGSKKIVSGEGLELPGLTEDLQVRRNLFRTILEAWFYLTGHSPLAMELVICCATARGAAALTLMKFPYL